jgi:pimeloyl-ACP methyl ester carboxylesterase
VVAVILAVAEPVFLLGHSYGAHCALLAAQLAPDWIRRLVLYEPPWPNAVPDAALAAHLEPANIFPKKFPGFQAGSTGSSAIACTIARLMRVKRSTACRSIGSDRSSLGLW